MTARRRWQSPDTARLAVYAIAAALLAAVPAHAQDFDSVEIVATDLGGGVHMLTGRGGNMAVSIGDDGTILIDDQYAPLTPRILAAIGKLGGKSVRFVLNTHWHADHTGGNENLGRSGALIVAHDNVRVRMSAEQLMAAFGQRVPASPEAALPIVTFGGTLTLHVNGQQIRAIHVEHAHTDSDSLIHLTGANVIHMGDTFFNGIYPFIDHSSGGTVDGTIAAADRALAIANDQTRIIPGHGPLASRRDLERYRAMLADVRERIAASVRAGRTAAEVVAARPTADYDEEWGDGFLKPDAFVQIVYATLAR